MGQAVQRIGGQNVIVLSAANAAADVLLHVPAGHRFLENWRQKLTVIFPFLQGVASGGFRIGRVRTVGYHSIYGVSKQMTVRCTDGPGGGGDGTFSTGIGAFCGTCSPAPPLVVSPVFLTVGWCDLRDVLRGAVDQILDIFLLPRGGVPKLSDFTRLTGYPA